MGMFGPTIILDKSAFQALGPKAVLELDRYFSVIKPPVLLLEILADLKKSGMDSPTARREAQKLARKIQPVGKINVDFRTLCTSNLFGGPIPMKGQGILGGARQVRTDKGEPGLYRDIQPEDKALWRWSNGVFDGSEELLATQWRESLKDLDLESLRNEIGLPFDQDHKPTLRQLWDKLDDLFEEPQVQFILLRTFLEAIRAIPETVEWTFRRWNRLGRPLIRDFSPYAYHCARLLCTFYYAIAHNLIGTRASNVIDLEYLFYTPFANIFCSGDRLHSDFASACFSDEHSFISRDELCVALNELAERRSKARQRSEEGAWQIEPHPESLIRLLWIKHRGHWQVPTRASKHEGSQEEREALMQRVQPYLDAIENARRSAPLSPRWPCP